MAGYVPDRERIIEQLREESKRMLDERTKEILLDYHLTFQATAHGQRVLQDLIDSYNGNSFTPGYADVTAFKEGRRSVAEDIVSTLRQAETLGVIPKISGGSDV
jgi:hypothetical protein